jgi:beta-phosphoglucomutase-like phosphatase (HAD superfamily)
MSGPAGRHQAGGLVFDCDGVLADTTPCWEEAFSGVAAEFGLALRRDQLAALRGAALVTAARRMAGWSRRPVAAEEVLKALREQLVASIDAAELMLIEGVRELLEEFHGIVRLGVASNSPRAVLRHILARLAITGYFAAVISAEDVARPKPAPDPYLAACRARADGLTRAQRGSRRAGQRATGQIPGRPPDPPADPRPGRGVTRAPTCRDRARGRHRAAATKPSHGKLFHRIDSIECSSSVHALVTGKQFRPDTLLDIRSAPPRLKGLR